RLRDLLVIAEIALSLALLAGAGLLIRSFQKLRTAETGVKPENVLTFSTLLPKAGYEDLSRQRAFFDQLVEPLSHSPGVTSAALATELPVEGGSNGYITAQGDTDPTHANLLVEENYITSGYFAALGVPFLSGTNFSPADMDRTAEMTQRLLALRKADPNSKVTPPDISC